MLTTPLSYPQNTWTSVAIVCHGGTGYIYVDGVLAVSGAVAPPTYGCKVQIGSDS
jgi:hypothetical protein